MKIFIVLSVLVLATFAQTAPLCTDCPSCNPNTNPDFPLPGDVSCNAKVVFIMDESGSIRDFRSQATGAARAFWTALSLLNSQGGTASLGLIEFSDTARVVQPVLKTLDAAYLSELNTYIQSNASGVSGYDPQGVTNWGSALRAVHDTFNTPENTPDIVVFFTDGEPNGHQGFDCDATCIDLPQGKRNGDTTHACFEADRIKERGIKLFTVGVGDVAGHLAPIQIISGGSIAADNFGEGSTAWDLTPSSFGTADYIVDPDLNNLGSVLREVANALCPRCESCAVFPTNSNPETVECTGPEPPTFDPVTFTQSGSCGPARLGVQNDGWTGSCKQGTVTHTLAVLDTCDQETDLQFSYITTVVDSTPPTLVCPASLDLGQCEDALTAIQELTTVGADTCSGVSILKSEIRTVLSDTTEHVTGYEVTFLAEDGCEIPSEGECVVRYTCGDGADLEVKKFSNIEDCAVAGDDERDIRYTITVQNHGPAVSRDVVLTDVFPTGGILEQRGAITTTVGEVISTADGLAWTVGDLQVGQEVSISFRLFLDASFEVGLITNWAKATSSTADPNLCNNEDKDVVRVCRESDLSVSKTDNLLQVTAGEKVGDQLKLHVYEVEVTNNGVSDANNVEVVDEWPEGFTIVQYQVADDGVCSDTIGGFRCSWPHVPAGESRFFFATYTVPFNTEAGPQINSVHVSSDSKDPNGENNHNNDITYVRTEADLSVAKSDGVTEVTAGDGVQYTYTISVTNNGPSLGREVSVFDRWPDGFTRTDAVLTPSQGSCVSVWGDSGSFSCNFGTLNPGQVETIQATYWVPSTTQECDVFNVAEVSGTVFDGNICNNVARDTNSVLESAELGVFKTAHHADGTPVEEIEVGSTEEFYYRIYVTNLGPSTARQTTLTDTWPTSLTQYKETLTCSQGGCATTGADFTCALGSIKAHFAVICTVKFTLSEQQTTAGELRNDVTVFSPTDTQCRSDSHSLTVFVSDDEDTRRFARQIAGGKPVEGAAGLAPEHIVVKTKLVDGLLTVTMRNPHVHSVSFSRFVINTLDAKNVRGHVVLSNDASNTCAALKSSVLEPKSSVSCTVTVGADDAAAWKRGSFTVQGLSQCSQGLRPLLTTEAIL